MHLGMTNVVNHVWIFLAKTQAPTRLPIWIHEKMTFAQFPLSNHAMGSLWFKSLYLNVYVWTNTTMSSLMFCVWIVLVLFMWVQLFRYCNVIESPYYKSMQLLCHFPHPLTHQQAPFFGILFFHSNGQKRND